MILIIFVGADVITFTKLNVTVKSYDKLDYATTPKTINT